MTVASASGADERPEPSARAGRAGLPDPFRFLSFARLPRLGLRSGFAAALALLVAVLPGLAHAVGEVTNLSATTVDSASVRLSWSAPSVAGKTIKFFRVQYSNNDADLYGASNAIASTAGITVSGLAPGITYKFGVRTIFTDRTISSEVMVDGATSAATGGPRRPTNLSVTPTTPTSMKLEWKAGTKHGTAS